MDTVFHTGADFESGRVHGRDHQRPLHTHHTAESGDDDEEDAQLRTGLHAPVAKRASGAKARWPRRETRCACKACVPGRRR